MAEINPRVVVTARDQVEQELISAYQAHAATMIRYSLQFLREPGRAEHAVQEVFLRYFQFRKQGRQVESRAGWLFRSLRLRLAELAQAMPELCRAPAEPDAAENPEWSWLCASGTRQKMRPALSRRECDCLSLRAEGLHYAEIAEVLGIRTGQVSGLLAGAQAKIHKHIEREEGERRRQVTPWDCAPEEHPHAS